MFRKAIFGLLVAGDFCLAQAPAPSPTLSPSASRSPETSVTSLAPAEIDEAIKLLKSNFVDPNALKDQEMNRATLEGLLARLHGGALLLPGKTAPTEETPFYSDIISNHIGYLRLGAMTKENLRALDQALANSTAKKVDAVVIDLRASSVANDFEVAAEMAKRFAPKGAMLLKLTRPGTHQERVFTNDREPSFRGPMMVLIDNETAGAAEAMAAALKSDAKALLIGASTAGRAVEYADFPLASGKVLRVATAEASASNGQSLFPGAVQPDLAVDFPSKQKYQIFALSAQRGMAPFVFEAERPHFNEAALISGINPELEARATRKNDELHDAVLQRAVDVIVSLAVFQKH